MTGGPRRARPTLHERISMTGRHPARLAALTFAALCTSARAADEAKVETSDDLVYTKVGDRELKLDLARPGEGDGPFPAVVVIHGGAWRQGNKADVRPILAEFARRRYV